MQMFCVMFCNADRSYLNFVEVKVMGEVFLFDAIKNLLKNETTPAGAARVTSFSSFRNSFIGATIQ